MAEIPEDIKEGIKTLATTLKVPSKTLVDQIKEFIESDDAIKRMPPEQDEFKIRYAWANVCRRYTATGGEVQMYIRPLCIPRARQITSKGVQKYVGDMCALIKRIDIDEEGNQTIGDLEYGAGTLWEKAAEKMLDLSSKKIYKTALKATAKKGANWEGLELGGNDATFTEVTDGTVKFPTNQEFYDAYLKPKENDLIIELGEKDLNKAENSIDIRIIKAQVVDVGAGETAKGGEFGRYTVSDNSLLGGGKDGKPGSEPVWVHPTEAIYEKGSILIYIGSSQYDTDANLYRWTNHFVLPTGVAVLRVVEAKPVEKDSVDVSDLDKELDAEHKKVEENLDDAFAI